MKLCVKGRAQSSEGIATFGDKTIVVVLGRSGLIDAATKREGDGCTPLGHYKVLYGLYRPDRVPNPAEGEGKHLKWLPITPELGWCDAPHDPLYNSMVPVGYAASHEMLWREDSAYDRVLVISHNLPAVPHRGSAVFVHQLHAGKTATAGCVALAPADMLTVLAAGVGEVEIGVDERPYLDRSLIQG